MKPSHITREWAIEAITEIHEGFSAVTPDTITETVNTLLDSIQEDAFWSETSEDVTVASLRACVEAWLADRAEAKAEEIGYTGTGFETMTIAELREYAETVQAEYDADELSGAMGRAVVRGAWERLASAEAEANAVAPILDSSIAAAVSSMMNAVEQCHEPDAARRTAEIVSAKIKASGGETWINPMWYGVDLVDTSAPAGRYDNPRGFEYIKWPRAQVRDVVEYEGKSYRVAANYVSPGKAGQWVNQFSFYALMPANQ